MELLGIESDLTHIGRRIDCMGLLARDSPLESGDKQGVRNQSTDHRGCGHSLLLAFASKILAARQTHALGGD